MVSEAAYRLVTRLAHKCAYTSVSDIDGICSRAELSIASTLVGGPLGDWQGTA